MGVTIIVGNKLTMIFDRDLSQNGSKKLRLFIFIYNIFQTLGIPPTV